MFAINLVLLIGIIGITYGYPRNIDETNFDYEMTNLNNDNNNEMFDDFINYRAKRENDITIQAEQERGQGTSWKVDGDRRVWTSDNGRSTLDGNVHYERGGDRDRDFRGGFTFRHRF